VVYFTANGLLQVLKKRQNKLHTLPEWRKLVAKFYHRYCTAYVLPTDSWEMTQLYPVNVVDKPLATKYSWITREALFDSYLTKNKAMQ